MSTQRIEPTEARIVAYAVWFATERIETFNKDITICLRTDERDRHAYMPAMMACTGILELFACLIKGNLEATGNDRLVDFANRFMNVDHYSATAIEVLWRVFRHKVAHVSKPYGITHIPELDMVGRKGLVTWEVTEYDHENGIFLLPLNLQNSEIILLNRYYQLRITVIWLLRTLNSDNVYRSWTITGTRSPKNTEIKSAISLKRIRFQSNRPSETS